MKAEQPELILKEPNDSAVGTALQLLREALDVAENRIRWRLSHG